MDDLNTAVHLMILVNRQARYIAKIVNNPTQWKRDADSHMVRRLESASEELDKALAELIAEFDANTGTNHPVAIKLRRIAQSFIDQRRNLLAGWEEIF